MKTNLRLWVKGVGYSRVDVEFRANPITSGELYSLVSVSLEGREIPVEDIHSMNPGLDGMISLEHLGKYAMEELGVDLRKKPRKKPKGQPKLPDHPTML